MTKKEFSEHFQKALSTYGKPQQMSIYGPLSWTFDNTAINAMRENLSTALGLVDKEEEEETNEIQDTPVHLLTMALLETESKYWSSQDRAGAILAKLQETK